MWVFLKRPGQKRVHRFDSFTLALAYVEKHVIEPAILLGWGMPRIHKGGKGHHDFRELMAEWSREDALRVLTQRAGREANA